MFNFITSHFKSSENKNEEKPESKSTFSMASLTSTLESVHIIKSSEAYKKKFRFLDHDSFAKHSVFCFLILNETHIPLDLTRLIIRMMLMDGTYFLNFESDFDKNGILYYLGTNEYKSPYDHPEKRKYVKCTPEKFYSGNILQAFCHDVTTLFAGKGYDSSIVQNWHYTDEHSMQDVLTKDLCMYIQFLEHSIIPVKYTMRHGYPGGHAMRSWNFEATNDTIADAIINKTWVVLDERVDDLSINHAHLINSASFDVQKSDGTPYHTFRLRLTGPNSSQSPYFMMAGFEFYGSLFHYRL
jgi:hypothetical protein